MGTTWKHDDLANDLAGHLRGNTRERMVWTDMQLGPAGSPRPDVYTIECSYSKFLPVAFECKISRADFLSDVTSGKALRYLDFAGALVFACPAGMVDKAEVPNGCGLIVRHDEVWRYLKRPKISPIGTLPRTAWMKLLMDGRERDLSSPAMQEVRSRLHNQYRGAEMMRNRFGEEMGRLYRNREAAEYALRQAIEGLERQRAEAVAERSALEDQVNARKRAERDEIQREISSIATELGLPPDCRPHMVISAMRDLRPEHDRERLMVARNTLNHAIGDMRRRLDDIDRAIGPAPTPIAEVAT